MNDHDVCFCGHIWDEHGGDPEYPGSTACTVKDCPCITFDHDTEAGQENGQETRFNNMLARGPRL